MMKWLTLEWIKSHSRIDFDCEDELLEMYGESAEESVLNDIGRSYENVMETYGQVPTPLFHAALMLVDESYQQRSPVSSVDLKEVAYGYGFKIMPYRKLTYERNENNNENEKRYGCKNL